MNRTTLLALAERVEAATGADRELDGLVFAHTNPDKRVIIGQKPGRFPQDPIYGGPLDIIWIDGFADVLGAPRYTASLDAAMSLVPCGWSVGIGHLPGVDWLIRAHLRDHRPQSLTPAGHSHIYVEGHNKDFALALTAASLRAIAGSMTDD